MAVELCCYPTVSTASVEQQWPGAWERMLDVVANRFLFSVLMWDRETVNSCCCNKPDYMNMNIITTSYNHNKIEEEDAGWLICQDEPDRMLMVVNMAALHDTPSLADHHHHHQNAVRCCQTCSLMTLGSLLTPDRKQGHQINTREEQIDSSSLPPSLAFISTIKLILHH